MTYQLVERPKLQSAKSLKLISEDKECLRSTSFRHRRIAPNFDLNQNKSEKSDSTKRCNSCSLSWTSKKEIKPLHNHTLHDSKDDRINNTSEKNGDFLKITEKYINPDELEPSVIDILEEKYWANWKPEKTRNFYPEKLYDYEHDVRTRNQIRMIKNTSDGRNKYQIRTRSQSESRSSSFSDILTAAETQSALNNVNGMENMKDVHTEISEESLGVMSRSSEEYCDMKFLKHTDSKILHSRKQNRETYDCEVQPQYIRLTTRRPTSARAAVPGHPCPLRSCLKTESVTSHLKGCHRLERPGSPIIVTSKLLKK